MRLRSTNFAVVALHDGRQQTSWDCDRGVLQSGKLHHVVITVDGGPKIITFVVDGVLCDGGDHRQFGGGRFSPTLRTPNGAATLKIAPADKWDAFKAAREFHATRLDWLYLSGQCFASSDFPVTICRIDLSTSRLLMNTEIQMHPGLDVGERII